LARTMDRHRLQHLVETVPDDPDPDLREAVAACREGLNEALTLPQLLLYPGLSDSSYGTAVRILSRMSESEETELLQGRTIPIRRLSQSSQAVFAGRVLGSSRLKVGSDPHLWYFDLRSDPTESADALLPSGAYVALDDKAVLGVQEAPDPGKKLPTTLSAESLAYQLAEEGISTRYRVVVRHEIELRWYVAPDVYWSFTSHLHEAPKDRRFLPLDSLPKDLKSKVDALVKVAQEDIRKRDAGDPPPPR